MFSITGPKKFLPSWKWPTPQEKKEKPLLHVYNWYGMIPEHLIRAFEQETGITVRYDLYDNNEIVEAKLLSGKSGYDLVFPSAAPYLQRQIAAGVYQKLDKTRLPNLVHIDPHIYHRMRDVDPQQEYSLPYYWGTLGFAYVKEEIDRCLPDAPVHSYRMLFDPNVVKHLKACGVTLLDEAVDVFPAAMHYLGYDPYEEDQEALLKTYEYLLTIRPFINRFSSSRFVNELVAGESCLAQAWSGEAQLAQQRADEAGRQMTIIYVVPDEGHSLWIDAIAIPNDAPHPKNAHKFIDFLLRPEVSAAIANATQLAIANKDALPLIDPKICNNPTIYPPEETRARLRLDVGYSTAYERLRTRLWTQFRTGQRP